MARSVYRLGAVESTRLRREPQRDAEGTIVASAVATVNIRRQAI